MSNAKCVSAMALAMMCACGPDPVPVQIDFSTSTDAVTARAPVRYTRVELPQPPGRYMNGLSLNNANQVTGILFTGIEGAQAFSPFFYDPHTGTRGLNDTHGSGRAINTLGDVAEAANLLCGSQEGRALLAHPDGTYQNLGTVAGPGCEYALTTYSLASAVNDAGQVVGCSTSANHPEHAFVHQNGTMRDLGTLGGPTSCAYGINNRGQVVGYSTTSAPNSRTHAFLYENGRMSDISIGGCAHSASLINDAGEVVLNGEIDVNDIMRPYLYLSGHVQDLGAFNGKRTVATGLNNAGWIVGTGADLTSFLWENGQYHDLNALVGDPTLTIQPKAINDRGVILATVTDHARNFEMLLMPQEHVVAVAALDSSQATGAAPLWEGFDGTRSYAVEPSSWIAHCRWDFGDGSPVSTRCWDLHLYRKPGDYIATLTVTDNLNRTSSTTLHISATAKP